MTILDQLKRDEGRRATPYQDSRGIWTVGYGHNLTVGALSEAALEQILRDDLLAAETPCRRLPIWPRLSEARQGALLNMSFNLGFAGLMEFRQMFAALEAGDYEGASAAMLDSEWARQVGARAERLAMQMREDRWV
jgi:lysozyme